jgi:hypothetical protein
MDLKQKLSHPRFHRRRSHNRAELAAQLAPPEERDAHRQGAHQEVGAIVVENGGAGISNDLIEGGKEKRFLNLEPVVLAIVGLLLAWALFIAWLITMMPPE